MAKNPTRRYVIPVNPMGKPRMTQRDKWAKRPVVERYFHWRDAVYGSAAKQGLEFPESGAHVTFWLRMPQSWPGRKRVSLSGKPHQSRPDLDNLEKALLDALFGEDSGVWDWHTTKRWSHGDGYIEIIVPERRHNGSREAESPDK